MAEPHKPRDTSSDLNATEARGGSRGGTVRVMLVAGLSLVVIAFIVIYMIYG